MLFKLLVFKVAICLFLLAANVKSYKDPLKANDKPYDFIFGWSTGHVGTTTLSRSRTYGNPKNLIFLHETIPRPNNQTNFTKQDLRKQNPVYKMPIDYLQSKQEEYLYIKNIYIPYLVSMKKQYTTLIDLGHHNLYFIHGLVQYLEEYRHIYRILFIRVRRDRYETAISLTYKNPTHQHTNLCTDLHYRYCPINRYQDILLKPPNIDIWINMSEFQKALWMIDEVESRWKNLIVSSPSIARIEVFWSSMSMGSIEQAVRNIANAIGIEFKSSESIQRTQLHAGSKISDMTSTKQLYLEDRRYRELMQYNYNIYQDN
jgi:hypothetical protein